MRALARRLAASLSGLAAFVSLASHDAASGYALSGAKWTSRALPVKFKVDYASSRELGQATTQAVVEASFNAWSSPSCSLFRWTNLGAISGGTANANDGQNVLVWRYSTWPRELGGSSTIGVTTPVYYPGSSGTMGQMIDADIQFNGVDYRWVNASPTRWDQVDAQSIITHENGHFVGIDHSGTSSATMYASYQGGTGARSLHSDDIAAVCALYTASSGTECSATRACPSGKECQNGYCVDAPPPTGELGADCSGETQCGNDLYCACTDAAQTQCFCTRDCSTSAPCPTSWTCAPLEGGGGACVPSGSSSGGTGILGDNCSSGADCANGYCVGTTGTTGKCSQPCGANDQCPSGYRCASLQGGGGACIAGTVSPPRDGGTTTQDGGSTTTPEPKEMGEGCSGTFDCRSNYCAYKTEEERVCSRPCGGDGDCPESFECRPSATGTMFCFAREGGPVTGEEDAGTTEQQNDGGTGGGRRGGGCAAAGEGADLAWLLAAAALLIPSLRRRRMRSLSS